MFVVHSSQLTSNGHNSGSLKFISVSMNYQTFTSGLLIISWLLGWMNGSWEVFWYIISSFHTIVNILFKESSNMHFWQAFLSQGRSNFQSNLCWCFIIDLLRWHKFHRVSIVCRSWRPWKLIQRTLTYLLQPSLDVGILLHNTDHVVKFVLTGTFFHSY